MFDASLCEEVGTNRMQTPCEVEQDRPTLTNCAMMQNPLQNECFRQDDEIIVKCQKPNPIRIEKAHQTGKCPFRY
eukprot:5218999-Amphidinium_carterae.2